MDTTPLISIVMPCFNAAPYVTEAVESAMGQSHGNVQLIVVDDGSTDGSAQILSRLAAAHPGRMEVLSTNRCGPYPARNIGLQRARGELVAFLDADDWWLPDTLAKLYGALVEHDADMTYCGWQNVGEGIQSAPHVPRAYEDGDPVAHFLRTCPWPIHAALVRREVVDRLSGFSERCYASMDYDFRLRALAVTRRIKRVPEVLAFYRWHDRGQVSAVKWRQVLDALNAQETFIRENPGLVAHLPEERRLELTDGRVWSQAYRAFWKRDLVFAQKLFRHIARTGSDRVGDIWHLVTALLPLPAYHGVISLADWRQT